MRLVFLGPPGAGKGTVSSVINAEKGIPVIVMGDILRKEVAEQTELGKKAHEYMKKGELVPDDIIIGIIEKVLKEGNWNKGFILDGFPRSLRQAQALDEILKSMGLQLDKVVLLDVPEEVAVERLSGRRICPKCGAVYHVKNMPPKVEGKCDKCGAELIQREDDKPEVIRNRFRVYQNAIKPVIEFYMNKGLLVKIKGNRPVEEIVKEILE